MDFRGITAATGWVTETLDVALAALPKETNLGQALVLHSDQNEVHLILPSGVTYVLTIHQEQGEPA